MAYALFFLLSVVCIGSVLAMLLTRDRTHGALFLVLAFAALGGLFGLLDAPFVAAVQVLVYAGAIMVLFLFVIMTVEPGAGPRPERKRGLSFAAVLLALALFVELLLALRGALGIGGGDGRGASTARLGEMLLGPYLYAFEVASVLIVAALTGAVAIVGRKGRR